MLYGLTGASGVGKSTVGKLVADSLDITFLETSITRSAYKHGFDPVAPMSLKRRIDLQYHLLDDHVEMIEKAVMPVIADRTPVDLIGYMLGEIDMQSHARIAESDLMRVSSYVENCIQVAAMRYDFLFHLAPLPFYEQADTRPAENPAYQAHTDMIMRGVLSRLMGRVGCSILNTTDLDERQTFIHDTIIMRLDQFERARQTHPMIH